MKSKRWHWNLLSSGPDRDDPLGGRFTDSIAIGRVSQPESERDREEDEGTLRGRTERGRNRDQPKSIIRLRNDLREVQVIKRFT